MPEVAPVIFEENKPEVEKINNNGEETLRAEFVPEAQLISDYDEPEYINEEGYETIARTSAVPETSPVIVNVPSMYKEMVPATAPLMYGTAPEITEATAESEVVPQAITETQTATKEYKLPSEENRTMTTDDIPRYGEFKQFYFEKGAGAALSLFIYYHPTPYGYRVIEHIEKEIKEGNRGYTIDGVYYDCPENDPYFANRRIINT